MDYGFWAAILCFQGKLFHILLALPFFFSWQNSSDFKLLRDTQVHQVKPFFITGNCLAYFTSACLYIHCCQLTTQGFIQYVSTRDKMAVVCPTFSLSGCFVCILYRTAGVLFSIVGRRDKRGSNGRSHS